MPATSVTLEIDGKRISVPEGTSVLEAAKRLDIHIPTLCFRDDLPAFTSCMICVVHDLENGALIPSCSTRVRDGMRCVSDDDTVRTFRRNALNLLLSEHRGDCDAPCLLSCPVGVDAPRLMRLVSAGDWDAAAVLLGSSSPLPRSIAAICPAPCEKACRRGRHDAPLAIQLLEAHIAAKIVSPASSASGSVAGRSVAVVGGGPAGLAAAWLLAGQGLSVRLHEASANLGGRLLADVAAGRLDETSLESDLEALREMGVEARTSSAVRVGGDVTESVRPEAVIWAAGAEAPPPELGDELTAVMVVCGDAAGRKRSAVHAAGDGLAAARGVLARLGLAGPHDIDQFNCTVGVLSPQDLSNMLADASPTGRIAPTCGTAPVTDELAVTEASRCMHCDCRKAHACRLRDLATVYGASHRAFQGAEPSPVTIDREHPTVVFEAGKCIRCGLCVRICEASGVDPGLTFHERGYDVRVGPPLGYTLSQALRHNARPCVESCPTGALAWKST